MSKLDVYAQLVEKKVDYFKTCIRSNGPWHLFPTNKGGIIFQYNGKDVKTDISIKELKEVRDLIDCFLKEVAE